MVAYKKISPRENEADFLKIERRDLFQSKTQKMASTFVLQEPYSLLLLETFLSIFKRKLT